MRGSRADAHGPSASSCHCRVFSFLDGGTWGNASGWGDSVSSPRQPGVWSPHVGGCAWACPHVPATCIGSEWLCQGVRMLQLACCGGRGRSVWLHPLAPRPCGLRPWPHSRPARSRGSRLRRPAGCTQVERSRCRRAPAHRGVRTRQAGEQEGRWEGGSPDPGAGTLVVGMRFSPPDPRLRGPSAGAGPGAAVPPVTQPVLCRSRDVWVLLPLTRSHRDLFAGIAQTVRFLRRLVWEPFLHGVGGRPAWAHLSHG